MNLLDPPRNRGYSRPAFSHTLYAGARGPGRRNRPDYWRRLRSGGRSDGCRGMSGPRERVFEAGRKEAMVFQATKWSWKRIAARVLLIPVLAGGSAAIAHAQLKTAAGTTGAAPQTKTAASPVMTAAPAGDPKAMLK